MATAREANDPLDWLRAQQGNNQVSKNSIDELITSYGTRLPDVVEEKLSSDYSQDFGSAEDNQIFSVLAELVQEQPDKENSHAEVPAQGETVAPTSTTEPLVDTGSALEGMQDQFNQEIPAILLADPGLADVLEQLGEVVGSVLQKAKASLNDEGKTYVDGLVARFVYDEICVGLMEAMQENGDTKGAALSEDEIRKYLALPDAW